jgi:hypothetical protein
MDQRERYSDDGETFRLAFQAMQSRLWTSMPCVVKKFPAASGIGKMILDAQPTINGIGRAKDGTPTTIQMPVLLDCPILWQGGGGVTGTFPIKADDECLVILASRCIDAWWQQGFQSGPAMNPPDLRMHSLSDGFALVGLRSLPREFAVDTANACLISDDGQTFFKLNPTTKAIAAQASGGINLNGVTIDSSGNLHTPATITGDTDVIAAGKSGKGHQHTDPQGGVVSPPI